MDSVGQEWAGAAYPVELLSLGGPGTGVPVRATLSGAVRCCWPRYWG